MRKDSDTILFAVHWSIVTKISFLIFINNIKIVFLIFVRSIDRSVTFVMSARYMLALNILRFLYIFSDSFQTNKIAIVESHNSDDEISKRFI